MGENFKVTSIVHFENFALYENAQQEFKLGMVVVVMGGGGHMTTWANGGHFAKDVHFMCHGQGTC